MLPWERFPRLYRLYRTNPLSGLFLRHETASLLQLTRGIMPPGGGRVLDIGTGTGYALAALPRAAATVAIDICMPLLRQARAGNPGLRCLQADARRLPFAPETFALASMVGVTDYIEDKHALLRSLWELLEPDGLLLITFAPATPLNGIRRLLGHRLHLLTAGGIGSLVAGSPFSVRAFRRTALQHQYLLQKTLR